MPDLTMAPAPQSGWLRLARWAGVRAVAVSYLALIGVLLSASASAAVFQYSVPAPTVQGVSEAFLWLPPTAETIRGVVMAGMTLMERELVKDAVIRDACAEEQLALVFLKCGLSATEPQKVLDDLAAVSGYAELSSAPFFFIGHSAGGPQAKARAIQFADRCFGVVQYRGGVPGGAESIPPGIPALMMIGQFDEFGGTMRNASGRESWEGVRDHLTSFRAAHARNLGSVVVEPGAGHFAWSDRNARYLARFIRKAAQARIGAGSLRFIQPSSGWLTDLRINASGAFPPAPYEHYAGPRANAAWHFDREMAEATVAYHADGMGRRDQFIRWNDPIWVDAGARHFFTKLQWVGDGQTFEVHPVYADTYPALFDGKGPRWADAGKPAGHSVAPILVRPVSGPVAVAGTNLFRMQFDGLAPVEEAGRVTFLAFSAGDARHRYTEQVGMMPRGFAGLKTGRPQRITFAPMGNLKAGGGPVKLSATSDAGLPVEFYVAHGPAVVTAGAVRAVEVPDRAKFPIAVKVVAWQFGRAVEPLVQTAAPVEQIIQIEKP